MSYLCVNRAVVTGQLHGVVFRRYSSPASCKSFFIVAPGRCDIRNYRRHFKQLPWFYKIDYSLQ